MGDFKGHLTYAVYVCPCGFYKVKEVNVFVAMPEKVFADMTKAYYEYFNKMEDAVILCAEKNRHLISEASEYNSELAKILVSTSLNVTKDK